MSTPRVSVIIPYYQNEKGLLSACVNSVLQQEGLTEFEVIVIDDGSPVSAEVELREILTSDSRVRVINQQNSGPGKARNKGLENISKHSEFVALLDSDDRWDPEFLLTAISALNGKYDIYFANTERFGIQAPRFNWQEGNDSEFDLSLHRLIDKVSEIYEFTGNFFEYALRRSNIISTSALVYRRSCAPNLRFNSTLFNGQDRLFKLHLSKVAKGVCFCKRVLVQEGKGVNIFDSSGWGSPSSLRLLCNYLRLSKYIKNEFTLNIRQREYINMKLNEVRDSIGASFWHLMGSRKPIDASILWTIVREDPVTLPRTIVVFFKILVKRIFSSGNSHNSS